MWRPRMRPPRRRCNLRPRRLSCVRFRRLQQRNDSRTIHVARPSATRDTDPDGMIITGSTALVTGANRGLGRALVDALRDAGCARIFAGARRVAEIARDAVVEPVALDITRADQVAAAVAHCRDVSILINNAGVAGFSPALGAPTIDAARLEMETNYFGTLAMCRAFAPVLRRNGGGALVNVLSV